LDLRGSFPELGRTPLLDIFILEWSKCGVTGCKTGKKTNDKEQKERNIYVVIKCWYRKGVIACVRQKLYGLHSFYTREIFIIPQK